ncbi:MAG: D-aminoacylase [Acidobacteria bacterium]|nr:D-aminoacylase [Acidobacteriota bacterium]
MTACASPPAYDIILRGGTIYDGSGGAPFVGDVALRGDTIAALGDLGTVRAVSEIDVSGLAVSPGFINILSWATESLIQDGRSQGDIRQGVTLEIFGEGSSMGPLNQAMRQEMLERQKDIRFDIDWTTLDEYLQSLVRRGVSPNVASFIGATTVRVHTVGYEDRPPTPVELDSMRALVRQAMEEGALGVGSSLIYAPAFYAGTRELIALARVAAESGGSYISHIRSEGNRLLEAMDELIGIAREAEIHAEIYHLKAAGEANWSKLEDAIRRIMQARAEGLDITADIYPYTAGATGLDAAMPPWVQEGGHRAWVERLRDPAVRRKVAQEMDVPSDAWENLYLAAGPEKILLMGFKSKKLKPLTGMTLAAVAASRGTSPAVTAMDLVVEDDSRVETLYFLMSEENVRRKVVLPWVSFGSDEASQAPEGVFLESNPHPRAYGTFARVLGRYVREEKLISLQEAIRRMTSLPAEKFKLQGRGRLDPGSFADVVVFDPQEIQDHATYDNPHRYASGVVHVYVNGVQVLEDGEHTGATPGRVVRGPGWNGSN